MADLPPASPPPLVMEQDEQLLVSAHLYENGQQLEQAAFDGPLDAGAERGLIALKDSPPGAKPFYPYSTLIRYAIKGSPEQKLLLEDIYSAIEQRFPYFAEAPPGWKNSVRHNLSLNPCFEKIPRPLTDRGKGAYWIVNDNVDPRSGVHRERRKKTYRRKTPSSSHDDDAEEATMPGPSSGTRGAKAAAERAAKVESPTNGSPYLVYDPEGNRVAYAAWPNFGPGGIPMMANVPIHYVMDPNEDELTPEFDDDGLPIWRTIWLNELVKLRRATYDQDSNGSDPDWYRAMVERVRAAFLQPQSVYVDMAQHVPEEGDEEIDAEE